jgi:hypothetical protein
MHVFTYMCMEYMYVSIHWIPPLTTKRKSGVLPPSLSLHIPSSCAFVGLISISIRLESCLSAMAPCSASYPLSAGLRGLSLPTYPSVCLSVSAPLHNITGKQVFLFHSSHLVVLFLFLFLVTFLAFGLRFFYHKRPLPVDLFRVEVVVLGSVRIISEGRKVEEGICCEDASGLSGLIIFLVTLCN